MKQSQPNPLDGKLIIYDSNCKVCSTLRNLVLKFTAIPEEKIKAYKDVPPHLTHQVDADKFRNVMALIDITGGKTLYGAEGVAYIFSSQYKLARWLLSFKPFLKLFTFLYKTQAYNRYIMATPKSEFQCDCFPDKVVKYRISYISICLLISIFLTALFGISLQDFVEGTSTIQAAGQMLLIAGSGWVAQMALALLFLKDKALDYIGHLGSIMVVGLLVLIPWIVLELVTDLAIIHIPLASVLLSSGIMLLLHLHRTRYLGLPWYWTITWFLLLQSTALGWVYVFYLR